MDLLTTKLFIPPLRPNLVGRRRLLDQLEKGRREQRPLTLISAPAGYGKTTLVAAWLQAATAAGQTAPRLAWLSLDENDNDPITFFHYIAATLTHSGISLPHTSQFIHSLTQLPPNHLVVTMLLNEVSHQTAAPATLLVLDDYHRIETAVIHDALQFWLDHAPPSLHLVLITREDPPFTLARWRVSSRLTEIRANDLRFTAGETAAFLNHTMGLTLTAADITALEQRTEGWVAGLQLAAIAAQGRPDPAEFIAAFSGSHQYVIDYLVEEVLRQQDESVRLFLQETAVLTRLNADLCTAVTGRADSPDILAYLERRNLFLVPLDDSRRWYRYHHLLRDSLRVGLDSATRTASHRRAAAWFAAHNLHAEAIDHAHEAADIAQAADLIRAALEPAFRQGEIRQIAAWLQRLPPDRIVTEPELCVFWLLGLILTGRSHDALAALPQIEPHTRTWPDNRQQARLLVIRAWLADITASPERVALARQAAAALPPEDVLFRAFIAVPLGHAYLTLGQLPQAITAFQDGVNLAFLQGTSFVRLSLLSNLIHTLNNAGRRNEASALCQQVLAEYVDADGQPLPPAGLLYLLRAWLQYDADNLAAAQNALNHSQELMRLAFQETMLSPLETELAVRLHLAAGDTAAAAAALQAGLDRATRQQYQHGMESIGCLRADLWLLQGELTAVRRWADALPVVAALHRDSTDAPPIDAIHDAIYLTYIRLLLAEGRADDARRILPALAETAQAGHRRRTLITVGLLQAAAGMAGPPDLAETITAVTAETYIRLVVDECDFPAHGPRLVQALREVGRRPGAPGWLLAYLAGGSRPDVPEGETAVTAAPPPSPHLLEPLTEQELVVLRLLADGMSNRQIAEELVITVGTAKWHVHNIYQKLDVTSRAEAVSRIHAWRLLE